MKLLQIDKIRKLHLATHWRMPLLFLAITLGCIFILYSGTVVSTTKKWWTSETYSHGILVIPLSLYMILTRAKYLSQMRPEPALWASTLLIPAVLIWIIGSLINVLVIQQFAVLAMIWASILSMLGWRIFRMILFPLAFLIFTVPFGEGLIPVLMDITAVFTVKALQLTGIPVFWEGMYFSIPSGNFEVAKACSGIRYMAASVTIGCLFAYLNYKSVWRRTLFILISILLPIIANGIRAYLIVMIAYLSGMKYAIGADHLVYGWLFFGVVMILLFYIGSKWRQESNIPSHESSNTTALPVSRNQTLITLIILLFVAALGPSGLTLVARPHITPVTAELSLPRQIGQWRMHDVGLSNWHPEYRGASHQLQITYSKDNRKIQLFIAYYANETQHAELVNQSNHLYNNENWRKIQQAHQLIKIDNSGNLSLQQLTLKSGKNQRLLWYWYDFGGYTTLNIYKVKLYQAWARIMGKDKGGAVIAIEMEVSEKPRENIKVMKNFVKLLFPVIRSSLADLRKDR